MHTVSKNLATCTLNKSIPSENIKGHNYTEIRMSHLSSFTTPPIAKPLPISRTTTHLSSPGFHKVFACCSTSCQETHVRRRNVALGLGGLVLGLAVGGGNAKAGRRPPPPPPAEKVDPNVSGVMAKVLASKKRKEAMKENIAMLREKGKPIKESVEEPTIQESSQ